MSDSVKVIIRQGDGIVARYGSGLLAILPGGSDEVQQQLLDAMREACEGMEMPGRQMARKLVGILSQADPDDVPPFGAGAPNERGWAVILHQGVALKVDRGGEMTTLSGFDASTWVDRIVDGGFDSFTLLPDGEEVGEVDTRFSFAGGLVPGAGATLMMEGAAPPAAGSPSADTPMMGEASADAPAMAEVSEPLVSAEAAAPASMSAAPSAAPSAATAPCAPAEAGASGMAPGISTLLTTWMTPLEAMTSA